MLKRLLLSALIVFGLSFTANAQNTQDFDKENTLFLDLKNGRVVIKMRPDIAPQHVARIKKLTREGFYDGIVFHRVIRGFMAQTGDPTGTGMGGSDYPDLQAEFSNELHKRGTLSMARSSSPHSANSQFFICFKKAAHLDGQYTVWGHVVEGMEFVDRIKKGSSYNGGKVSNPDKIIKLQIAADVK
ncbi:putative peptidyl-prolyl cis-trans isomerase [Candidatus Terasakiella magnetica]|uniref:Peptidyl-prolyl cis-trans isomerase n=1 Tax=Candidatus Terasakiella magnetica TaxID=1867952 RepID=A0A1C3RK94_9PROT|nr:peptidylprolyl isomerase [Candidatus Terasakiella magnetica]SCA57666.1 putative peptidyl-prolyl cis-trans isomerase [Candidatus Terasakiella magnetica]